MLLIDVHNPGVLEVYLGSDQQCYSTRVARGAVADRQEQIFYFGYCGASLSPLHHMVEAVGCVGTSKSHQKWISCDVGIRILPG